jgi:hypothetical protein
MASAATANRRYRTVRDFDLQLPTENSSAALRYAIVVIGLSHQQRIKTAGPGNITVLTRPLMLNHTGGKVGRLVRRGYAKLALRTSIIVAVQWLYEARFRHQSGRLDVPGFLTKGKCPIRFSQLPVASAFPQGFGNSRQMSVLFRFCTIVFYLRHVRFLAP